MPLIKLKNVSNYICRNVNLQVFDRELLVLFGPNGAGKTTLLNVIAGLVEYEGKVYFDNVCVDKIPAPERGIGYVFQNLVLFPHLDVFSNIAYGLKVRGQSQAQIETRVKELLKMMKIEHLVSRYPRHLSGGEKQRVVLARALAPSPEVLLLDEPMNNLDLRTTKYLRTELKQLQRKLKITTVYVTHNLEEAEEMADRIAVINNGRVEQVGTPEEIFFNPANEKVSNLIGRPNIFICEKCKDLGNGVMEVTCGGLNIIVPHDGNSIRRIALLPRDVYVSDAEPPGAGVNQFKGIITDINYNNETVRLTIKVKHNNITAEIPYQIYEGMDLSVGRKVFLKLKLRRIKVCELEDNYRL